MIEVNIGDKILYKKDGQLYEAIVKSIQGEKIELYDNSVKLLLKTCEVINDQPHQNKSNPNKS